MKYGKAYGGADPELIEGDVFRISIKYPDFKQDEGDVASPDKISSSSVPSLSQVCPRFVPSPSQVMFFSN